MPDILCSKFIFPILRETSTSRSSLPSIILAPIALTNFMVGGLGMQAVTAKHFEFMFFGGMIIFFLIVEPHGIARLWQIIKEKLRIWPLPY